MLPWFAAALSGPVFLLGLVFPGWGELPAPAPEASTAEVRAAPPASRPSGSVLFNNPAGPPAQQYKLFVRINRAIARAWPGSTIRVAEYSFAMPSTARALVAAHRRGVNVQVVVDDHSAPWASVRRLRTALGTDTSGASFLKVCRGSCRGGRGNQHAKFLTLSGTGHTQDVVMVGSMNFTHFNARLQWNDLYTVRRDPMLFGQFNRLFALMVRDRPQSRLVLARPGDGFDTEVSPFPRYRTGADPIVERLRRVRCTGAAAGAGRHGHTVIRIAMHAWNGTRGVLLARQVSRLERHGCRVKVLYGIGMGGRVAQILRRAGVPTRDSTYRGRHVHEKVMVLSGVLGNERDANYVWTGSHNWSDRSLHNDEVILRVAGRRIVAAYLRNFDTMWRYAAR